MLQYIVKKSKRLIVALQRFIPLVREKWPEGAQEIY